MRIHTSLTEGDVRMCLPSGVSFEVLTEHGSKTHERAFEVQLSGPYGRGRYTNTGTRGAGYVKAATWDEWGILLGRLFRLDENARVGSLGKNTIYADARDFRYRTGQRFTARFDVNDQHAYHKWINWNYGTAECKCGAVQRPSKQWMS